MVIDWALLIRYLAGSCTEAEQRQFEQWLAEAPEHQVVLRGAQRLLEQARRDVPADRTATLLASLRRDIAASAGAGKPPLRIVPDAAGPPRVLPLAARKSRRWAPASIAAAGLLLLGGTAAIWTALPRAGRHGVRSAGLVGREFVTARGQRTVLRLADGSSVVLGPASRLRILDGYNMRDRAVVLTGEGAFTVVHDAARPFAVTTARGVVVKDLGTQFDVREYGDDSSTAVVVAAGAVDLQGRAGRTGVTLRPGQLGQVDGHGAVGVRTVEANRYFAWTGGRLVFHDTPLRAAAAQLARWYDIEIRIAAPALAERHLTASVTNESPADVLSMVAASLDLELEVSGSGRIFTLRPR